MKQKSDSSPTQKSNTIIASVLIDAPLDNGWHAIEYPGQIMNFTH